LPRRAGKRCAKLSPFPRGKRRVVVARYCGYLTGVERSTAVERHVLIPRFVTAEGSWIERRNAQTDPRLIVGPQVHLRDDEGADRRGFRRRDLERAVRLAQVEQTIQRGVVCALAQPRAQPTTDRQRTIRRFKRGSYPHPQPVFATGKRGSMVLDARDAECAEQARSAGVPHGRAALRKLAGGPPEGDVE
jgi:hypothetical protein